MTNTSNKTENLLPFNVIAAAANGDTDAICAILKHYEGYIAKLSNKTFIESKTVDKNTLQSKYKVGNSVYIVNSHFAGKENLKELIFDIICRKATARCTENSLKA